MICRRGLTTCQPRGNLGCACPLEPHNRQREEPLAAKEFQNRRHPWLSALSPQRVHMPEFRLSWEALPYRLLSDLSMRIKPDYWVPSRTGKLPWRRLEATFGDNWQERAHLSKTVRHGLVVAMAALDCGPTEERIAQQPWTGSDFPEVSCLERARKPIAFRCELVSLAVRRKTNPAIPVRCQTT